MCLLSSFQQNTLKVLKILESAPQVTPSTFKSTRVVNLMEQFESKSNVHSILCTTDGAFDLLASCSTIRLACDSPINSWCMTQPC